MSNATQCATRHRFPGQGELGRGLAVTVRICTAALFLCGVVASRGVRAEMATASALHQQLLEEYSTYSKEYWKSWVGRKVGVQDDALAARDLLKSSPPRTIPIELHNGNDIRIENKIFRVEWSNKRSKYKGSIVYVRSAKSVTLKNLIIDVGGPAFAGYDTVLIEDCDNVVIDNVTVRGSAQSYHIRIAGSRNIYINNVDVGGIRDSRGEWVNGGGIYIENSTNTSKEPKENRVVIVQNSYIHDYTWTDIQRNQDAINVTSPRVLLIFNCKIENYGKGGLIADAATDVSFRRGPGHDGFALIERNVFARDFIVKTPGAGDKENAAIWRNNIFINTQFGTYNRDWTNYLLNNTFINQDNDAFIRLWGMGGEAKLVLRRNAFIARFKVNRVIYESPEGIPDKLIAAVTSSDNLFQMPPPVAFLSGRQRVVGLFSEWRGLAIVSDDVSSSQSDCDVKLLDGVYEVGEGCIPTLAPSAGAFERAGPIGIGEQDFYGRQNLRATGYGAISRDPEQRSTRIQ